MIEAIWTDNLIKVLEYENKLYKQLLALAENKTGIVVKGELENLQSTVGKEQKIISELNKLMDVREQIIDQMGKSTGKKPGELVITDLLPMLPPEHAARLSGIRDKLKATISKLTSQNDLNQKLIQNALDCVDFSLNLLTQPAPQAPQYGRKGNETGTKGRGMLDIKY